MFKPNVFTKLQGLASVSSYDLVNMSAFEVDGGGKASISTNAADTA